MAGGDGGTGAWDVDATDVEEEVDEGGGGTQGVEKMAADGKADAGTGEGAEMAGDADGDGNVVDDGGGVCFCGGC